MAQPCMDAKTTSTGFKLFIVILNPCSCVNTTDHIVSKQKDKAASVLWMRFNLARSSLAKRRVGSSYVHTAQLNLSKSLHRLVHYSPVDCHLQLVKNVL